MDSGDYGNFGTGTHVDVGRPFLLTARRSCSKVLAASVYWDDSRQEFVEVGPRVVIPVTYKGELSAVYVGINADSILHLQLPLLS